MTDDERLLVEWVIWNVRVCDLPAEVAAAAGRIDAAGGYPRPRPAAAYPPVAARVTAFPRDETSPLRDRVATRDHVGAAVADLFTPDVAYVLVCGMDEHSDGF